MELLPVSYFVDRSTLSVLSRSTKTGRSRRTLSFQSFCDLCEYRMLLVWRNVQELETSEDTADLPLGQLLVVVFFYDLVIVALEVFCVWSPIQ